MHHLAGGLPALGFNINLAYAYASSALLYTFDHGVPPLPSPGVIFFTSAYDELSQEMVHILVSG